MEAEFSEIFGTAKTSALRTFIEEHGLESQYDKATRNNQDDQNSQDSQSIEKLLDFGMEYGLVEIVAYCYCVRKCPVDIHGVILKYTGKVEDTKIPDDLQIPITVSSQKASTIPGQLWDRFSARRQVCLNYLNCMLKFSKRIPLGNKTVYTIVDKYIQDYRLLEFD